MKRLTHACCLHFGLCLTQHLIPHVALVGVACLLAATGALLGRLPSLLHLPPRRQSYKQVSNLEIGTKNKHRL